MLTAVEVHAKGDGIPMLNLPLLGNDGTGPFHIRNIEGLGPVKADVNSRGYGLLDGEYYTGSHVGKRNIVLTLGLNPGAGPRSVSTFRKLLYAYLLPKGNPLLRFVSDDRPTVQIEGYVEALEPTLFAKDPEVQVSVVCPRPYFESIDLKTVVGVARRNPVDVGFEFKGDITSGITFELLSGGSTYAGPILMESGDYRPQYRKFETNATINSSLFYFVSSHQGAKVVDSRNMSDKRRFTNLLKSLTDESLWPYVVPGINKLRVKINSDVPAPWILYYVERFGGL